MSHSRSSSTHNASNFKLQIGDSCLVNGDEGIIRFVGHTQFSNGVWVGVELSEPKGKNNGTVKDVSYFNCSQNHGIFARPSIVKPLNQSVLSPELTQSNLLSTSQSKINISSNSFVQDDSVGSLTGIGSIEGSRLEFKNSVVEDLKRKIMHLEIKLKTLNKKRSEDREKLLKYDKQKMHYDAFLQLKDVLSNKINKLQNESKKQKELNNLLISEREELESKFNEQVDNLESIVLDKEMAEEKADLLKHELETTKDKLNEVNLKLDILNKDENIEGTKLDNLKVVELEKQNDRLKEALLRLRDTTNTNEKHFIFKIKEIELKNSALEQKAKLYEELKQKNDLKDSTIQELKLRLDDTLEYEKMVEQLTEKNLELGAKVTEQNSVIEDYEALKDISEQLENAQLENIKQLQEEIEEKDIQTRKLEMAIEKLQKSNNDNINIISQYRVLTNSLQSDIEKLKGEYETKVSESVTLTSHTDAIIRLNENLKSRVNNLYHQEVEIKKMECELYKSESELQILKYYMSPIFYEIEEHKIASFIVTLKHIGFKIEALYKLLDLIYLSGDQKISIEDVKEMKDKINVCKIKISLSKIKGYIGFFLHGNDYLSKEFFKSTLCLEIKELDKKLDSLFDVLGKSRLDTENLENKLKKLSLTFEDLINIKFKTLKSEADYIRDNLQLEFNKISYVFTFFDEVKNILKGTELFAKNKNLMDIYQGFKVYIEKFGEFVEYTKKHKELDLREVDQKIKVNEKTINSAVMLTDEIFKKIIDHTQTSEITSDPLSDISEFIQLFFENYADSENFKKKINKEQIEAIIEDLRNSISETRESIQDEDNTSAIEIRAHEFLNKQQENTKSQKKLLEMSAKLSKLTQEQKEKDQFQQEVQIKCEFLEHKINSYQAQISQHNEMKTTLQNYERNEKILKQKISTLEQTKSELEKLNNKMKSLKIQRAPISKRRELPSMSSQTDLQKENLLKVAENFRKENARLRQLSWYNNLGYFESKMEYDPLFISEINDIIIEANQTRKILNEAKVKTKLVDLSKLESDNQLKLKEIKRLNSNSIIISSCYDYSNILFDKIVRLKQEMETIE